MNAIRYDKLPVTIVELADHKTSSLAVFLPLKQNPNRNKQYKVMLANQKIKPMQTRQLLLILFISFGAFHYNVFAQEAIPAVGGDINLHEGSVSYSVGQVVYNTHAGTSGSLTEGVQQPYEISVVTRIQEFIGINLLVSAYPNPANDYLILKSENSEKSDLTYSLYTAGGKLIMNKSIQGNETNIPLGEFRSGIYFLKVCNNHKELKTFKIVKN